MTLQFKISIGCKENVQQDFNLFYVKGNANGRRKYVGIFLVTQQPAIGTSPCRIFQGLFKEYKERVAPPYSWTKFKRQNLRTYLHVYESTLSKPDNKYLATRGQGGEEEEDK